MRVSSENLIIFLVSEAPTLSLFHFLAEWLTNLLQRAAGWIPFQWYKIPALRSHLEPLSLHIRLGQTADAHKRWQRVAWALRICMLRWLTVYYLALFTAVNENECAWTNQRYSFSGTLYKTEIRDRPKDRARLNCLIALKASKKV